MKIEELKKYLEEECNKFANISLINIVEIENKLETVQDVSDYGFGEKYRFVFDFWDKFENHKSLECISSLKGVSYGYPFKFEQIERLFNHEILEIFVGLNKHAQENFGQRLILNSEITLSEQSSIQETLYYVKELFELEENKKALDYIDFINRKIVSNNL